MSDSRYIWALLRRICRYIKVNMTFIAVVCVKRLVLLRLILAFAQHYSEPSQMESKLGLGTPTWHMDSKCHYTVHESHRDFDRVETAPPLPPSPHKYCYRARFSLRSHGATKSTSMPLLLDGSTPSHFLRERELRLQRMQAQGHALWSIFLSPSA